MHAGCIGICYALPSLNVAPAWRRLLAQSNTSVTTARSSTNLDLASTFVVIEPQHSVIAVAVTPGIYEELDARFDQFKGRLLVSSFSFDSDWSSWEAHPAGDEIVCLLSGDVLMVLDRDGVEEVTHLQDPGSFVIVPKGTWHTARTSIPTKLLFVTPGEGTLNKALAG
jgi:mannose-6-phosphate isomerase-like protein (cupin superfamily)